jgi:tetratricopeptide (TPR) repeat protein
LDADSAWALVFVDDVMALYLRRDGPLAAQARDLAYRELPAGANRLGPLGDACERDSLVRARVAAELERVIAQSPFHAQALVLQANLALSDGRYEDARALCRRSLALDPFREGTHLRLALIALERGEPQEALREAARERAVADPSARPEVVAGRAWARLGDLGRARAAYRKALKLEPANAEARDSLAALGGG